MNMYIHVHVYTAVLQQAWAHCHVEVSSTAAFVIIFLSVSSLTGSGYNDMPAMQLHVADQLAYLTSPHHYVFSPPTSYYPSSLLAQLPTLWLLRLVAYS